jgi:methylmalonyl-CoA mutase C-terminal domain/subunit
VPEAAKRIKVMITTLGLETHRRGAFTVAGMLRDQGMEVIYLGNAYPEDIIKAAIREHVDVVGISTLSGGHLTLGGELMKIAKEKNIKDSVLFIIGGVFPPDDIPRLKKLGFAGMFGPGTRGEEIADFIRKAKIIAQKIV